MPSELNDVKIEPRGYHHGDLRASLIAAAAAMIAETGAEGFSLRGAARRAGVSAAAPAHHFGDARGLLTAVATEGFIALSNALEAATGGDRRSMLIAQAHTYLDFALAHPGLFRLMWRKEMLDMADDAHVVAGKRAFAALNRVALGNDMATAAPGAPGTAASVAWWSAVHGFATLALDGAFAPQGQHHPALDTLLDATLTYLDRDCG